MDLTLLDGIDIEALLPTLDTDGKKKILQYIKTRNDYIKYNKHKFFNPEKWQQDAIELGSTELYRMVSAANRLGKSYFGTYEAALHATGLYPENWTGKRYNKPTNVFIGGVDWSQINRPKCTAELLLGTPDDRGSGWIPRDCMDKLIPKEGLRDTISKAVVKHYTNGVHDGFSTVNFGVYSAGDSTLMGMEIDFALLDEQVPELIFSQIKKRCWSSRGSVLYVATPEKGLDNVISQFWEEDGVHHNGLVHVTLWDSTLFTEEEKIQMNASIEPWARKFSIEGIPSAGTGAVFAGIVKETLLEPNIEIKPTFKRLCGADLGYKDDMVFSFLAKDDSTGIYYLYDESLFTETDAIICARAVLPKVQSFIPVILPPDGSSERGLGVTYKSIFESVNLPVLNAQTRNWMSDPTGADRSIKGGIMFIRELMMSGRLKIHPKCTGFLKEFDLYSYDEKGQFLDKNNHSVD